MLQSLTTLLALCALLGCAADEGARHFDIEGLAARYERDRRDFAEAQDRLEESVELPLRLDFADGGVVLIDQLKLVGRPDKAFLRLRFTWVNTAGRSYPAVDIKLTQSDEATQADWSESIEMRLPLSYSLTPDSSYTSWFEMPTHAAHLREGWSWELHVRPQEG